MKRFLLDQLQQNFSLRFCLLKNLLLVQNLMHQLPKINLLLKLVLNEILHLEVSFQARTFIYFCEKEKK